MSIPIPVLRFRKSTIQNYIGRLGGHRWGVKVQEEKINGGITNGWK